MIVQASSAPTSPCNKDGDTGAPLTSRSDARDGNRRNSGCELVRTVRVHPQQQGQRSVIAAERSASVDSEPNSRSRLAQELLEQNSAILQKLKSVSVTPAAATSAEEVALAPFGSHSSSTNLPQPNVAVQIGLYDPVWPQPKYWSPGSQFLLWSWFLRRQAALMAAPWVALFLSPWTSNKETFECNCTPIAAARMIRAEWTLQPIDSSIRLPLQTIPCEIGWDIRKESIFSFEDRNRGAIFCDTFISWGVWPSNWRRGAPVRFRRKVFRRRCQSLGIRWRRRTGTRRCGRRASRTRWSPPRRASDDRAVATVPPSSGSSADPVRAGCVSRERTASAASLTNPPVEKISSQPAPSQSNAVLKTI